ncbi:hypothetical protein OJAV_G00236590 [Oryzias javanicus]|uniref:Uncharacterized protein n=1 Tax=Oryzias javanicus TaxID=123683 RepID=A0A3S2NSS0_ORYJA|nr:hypothetical protein OJAV_G00236590 [Oryzias javanicus]
MWSSSLHSVLCTEVLFLQSFQLDMPVLRRWWCLLLLKNNSLNSYGKVFAHWTEEFQDLLDGKHSPVFRLKVKHVQNTEVNIAEKAPDDGRVCMAEPFKFCVFQTSTNTDKDSSARMSNVCSGCRAKHAKDDFTRRAQQSLGK